MALLGGPLRGLIEDKESGLPSPFSRMLKFLSSKCPMQSDIVSSEEKEGNNGGEKMRSRPRTFSVEL